MKKDRMVLVKPSPEELAAFAKEYGIEEGYRRSRSRYGKAPRGVTTAGMTIVNYKGKLLTREAASV